MVVQGVNGCRTDQRRQTSDRDTFVFGGLMVYAMNP